MFVYVVTNETTSENLVGFVVAFVKDYLGIQVGLQAVLFQYYIKTLIFFFSSREEKLILELAQSNKALNRK